MPDICISVWTVRLGIYLIPLNAKLNFAKIVLIFCYFYRTFAARAMASGRSSDMDQVGPSYAPLDPLPGTFCLGGSLEGRSVVDWFVRLIMEPLEHSVLATATVWEPLEHSNYVVTDHVDHVTT